MGALLENFWSLCSFYKPRAEVENFIFVSKPFCSGSVAC